MAAAVLHLSDAGDGRVAVRLDLSPEGLDEGSGAHQLAVFALEAMQAHLKDVQRLNEQPPG